VLSTADVARATDAPARNRALVHRLIEVVNDGDLEALAEIASGQIASEAERWIGPFRESFPDFRMEFVGVVAEADKVVGHFRCSGTHLGEWRRMPATGRRFEDVDEIYIFRVKDGKPPWRSSRRTSHGCGSSGSWGATTDSPRVRFRPAFNGGSGRLDSLQLLSQKARL
jgi:hypothetical protein